MGLGLLSLAHRVSCDAGLHRATLRAADEALAMASKFGMRGIETGGDEIREEEIRDGSAMMSVEQLRNKILRRLQETEEHERLAKCV